MGSYTKALVLIGVLFVTGCGGSQATMRPFEPIKTRHVQFQCEGNVNNGKPLAIDIIYITYASELREVTRLGPKGWFEAETRAQWKFKESVVVKGGDNMVVKLDPTVLNRTVMLVVYADFKNVLDPSGQQVIIDYAGKAKEIVDVRRISIQARSKALRYVK